MPVWSAIQEFDSHTLEAEALWGTLTFMRGSLVHDALYQLMQEKYLDLNIHREAADRILQKICKEDGMWSLRAWWVYHAVRLLGKPAANPADKRPVTRAPEGCQP